MYCPNCGKEMPENAKFCGNCGSEPGPNNDNKPRKGNWWWRILLVIIICAAAVAVAFFARPIIQERQFEKHMEDGNNFVEEEDYEAAVAEFHAAIDIDPKVVDPYIQLADAYQELDDTTMVETTYDTARDMIVETYDSEGELPEDSNILYSNAVEEAIENTDYERAEEIRDEYIVIAGEDAGAELSSILEQETEPEPSEEDIVKLSEASILEMLDSFAYWEGNQLVAWYLTDERHLNDETLGDLSSYEEIGTAQACAIAGRILYDQGYAEPAHDFTQYQYVDGKMIPADELTNEQQARAQGSYELLPMSLLEEYMEDLFGISYNAEDFAQHADEIGNEVKQDDEGQMYELAGDYGAMGVEVSIEDIADTPDEDGTYKVLARYDEFYDDDIPDSIYYAQYRVRPDENSKYGCVIVGMVPAGDGEIDPEYMPESDTDNSDASPETDVEEGSE